MEDDLTARDNIVSLSTDETSACVLDTTKGLALIREAIEKSMARNASHPKSAALLAVSVDNMSAFTGLFGDVVIDRIFTNLAVHLRNCLRGSDVIARLNEDQLGIVLPYFRFNGAAVAVKKVLALRAVSHYAAIDLKLSVVAVVFPDENITTTDVITRAQATLSYNKTKKDDSLELTNAVRATVKYLRSVS